MTSASRISKGSHLAASKIHKSATGQSSSSVWGQRPNDRTSNAVLTASKEILEGGPTTSRPNPIKRLVGASSIRFIRFPSNEDDSAPFPYTKIFTCKAGDVIYRRDASYWLQHEIVLNMKAQGIRRVEFHSKTLTYEHCILWREENIWYIQDHGSAQGTKLNGIPLRPAPRTYPIHSGDKIQLGTDMIEVPAMSKTRCVRMIVEFTEIPDIGDFKIQFGRPSGGLP